MKQELETDEDTDKEQGEHHKNCETSLDQGGVLSIRDLAYIQSICNIVTLDAHVDSWTYVYTNTAQMALPPCD